MNHRLLVSDEHISQSIACGEQTFSDAGDVAMTEDPKHSGEEAALDLVPLDVLDGQELDERLAHGQPSGPHRG